MRIFQYHLEITQRYPQIVGGVIFAQGIRNGPSPAELTAVYRSEQMHILQHLAESLGEIPCIAAWRRVFRDFGVKPTQYRSAAEALLRRLSKHGDIPSINTLVDLANMVSIRYALPVAAFDLHALQLPVTVHFSDGSESFLPLGSNEIEHPQEGEVVFSDETRRVVARRWCWRQSQDSAARSDTTTVLITVEGHHEKGNDDIRAALKDLNALLTEFAGGTATSAILTPDQPVFSQNPS